MIRGIFKMLLMRIAIVAILILLVLSCKTGIEYPEGGYDYVKNYKPEDTGFYFLPVRDSFSRRDSFWNAYYSKFTYSKFSEKNLSLSPLGEDIFRLSLPYQNGWTIFITLTKDKIIVKKNRNCFFPCVEDTLALTPSQKLHYNIFQIYGFPLTTRNKVGRMVPQSNDSLIKIYPELESAGYFLSLLKQVNNENSYNFSVDTINIQENQFETAVTAINKSGYWSMPVHTNSELELSDCNMDGYIFILEANTKGKYNFVWAQNWCPRQNPVRRAFGKLCQELIKLAHLDKEFWVYHDTY